MKKILKKEVIIAFIIGLLIASGITVYAYSYAAKDIGYTKPGTTTPISVETALNELYSKGNKTPQQVATLTTQGATYTMQNDGFITGTVSQNDGWNANVLFNGQNCAGCPNDSSTPYNLSLYATKGTIITTRSGHGVYNLTVYEWK